MGVYIKKNKVNLNTKTIIASDEDLFDVDIYIADFYINPPVVTKGALNSYRRVLVS